MNMRRIILLRVCVALASPAFAGDDFTNDDYLNICISNGSMYLAKH